MLCKWRRRPSVRPSVHRRIHAWCLTYRSATFSRVRYMIICRRATPARNADKHEIIGYLCFDVVMSWSLIRSLIDGWRVCANQPRPVQSTRDSPPLCRRAILGSRVRSTDVAPTRRFADRRYADNVGRFADIARMSARMSASWNAVFMQLYVSAKRQKLSA